MTWRGGWAVVDDEGAGEGDKGAKAHHEVAGLTWVLPMSCLARVRACNDVAVDVARRHTCQISLAWLKVSNWGEWVGTGWGTHRRCCEVAAAVLAAATARRIIQLLTWGITKTGGGGRQPAAGWRCCCIDVRCRHDGVLGMSWLLSLV